MLSREVTNIDSNLVLTINEFWYHVLKKEVFHTKYFFSDKINGCSMFCYSHVERRQEIYAPIMEHKSISWPDQTKLGHLPTHESLLIQEKCHELYDASLVSYGIFELTMGKGLSISVLWDGVRFPWVIDATWHHIMLA